MGLAAFNNYRRQQAAKKASAKAPSDDTAALRAEYERVMGKRPWMGWDADELRRRMAGHAEAPTE